MSKRCVSNMVILTAIVFSLFCGVSNAKTASGDDIRAQLSDTLEQSTLATEPAEPATDPSASQVTSSEPTAAAAEAPLTAPTLVDISKISAGDTAWMLTSTALVLFMTIPGLALFYAGMVRKKNVLSTLAHSFAITCLVTILWVVIGYSLAFTPGSMYIGGLDRMFLHGMDFFKDAGKVSVSEIAPTIPESVFVMFQMTFAIITPALITGAFAERMKFSALLLFMALWSVLVYAPVAHWVWEPSGWLASRGVLDFAGGTVVHINAGVSGLVAAIMIGPRLGFRKEPMPPHNLVLTVIGASMLWVGWFGFNAGSAVAADGRAGMAMLVTQLAAAVAAMTWMLVEWARRGKPSVLGMVSGAVSGLVAITPASGFVGVTGALAIGAAAGIACYWGATTLKSVLRYDDSLDVFGVHAIGGIVGALLTGVFAVKSIGGVTSDFATQAFGVVVTVIFSAVMTTIILSVVNMMVGLRVTPEAERDGLDLEQHGEHVL
tara:strand:- start:63516 stop:64985 length:1470 start_codon:yes stop_codon:yes gene_type:complete